MLERRRPEGHAIAGGAILNTTRLLERRRAQRTVDRIEIEPGPLRTRQRPFVFGSQHETLAGVADIERHGGGAEPAIVDAAQVVVEEAPLQAQSIIGGEQAPMRVAV